MNELPASDSLEDLTTWLETLQPDDTAIIAYRASMRTLPVIFAGARRAGSRNLEGISIAHLRLNLIAGLVRKFPVPEITRAADAALSGPNSPRGQPTNPTGAYADIGPEYDYEYDYAYELDAALPVTSAALAAVRYAADAPADAAAFAAAHGTHHIGVGMAQVALGHAESACDHADNVTRRQYPASLPVNSRREFESDAQDLIEGRDPFDQPLWRSGNWLEKTWDKSISILTNIPGGAFWIDWYQRALDGRPQNWPLLRDVALIEDALWNEGGRALDARINEIRLRHAIAATPNGERIEQEPETGLLRLVPESDLSDVIRTYVRRNIAGAVALFDDGPGNQYSALVPDLEMLRRALEDTSNLPVELFDSCVRAVRRLTVRIGNGDCPTAEKDPIIGEYRDRLRQAATDIRANDPTTQDILDSRNRIEGNNALIEGRETILAAVKEIGPIIIRPVAGALSEDVARATSSDTSAEDRKTSSYRLISRLLRIRKTIVAWVAGASGAIVGLKEVIEAIPIIQASPIFQNAIEIIFRYLGM
jgi:hypothetical protein